MMNSPITEEYLQEESFLAVDYALKDTVNRDCDFINKYLFTDLSIEQWLYEKIQVGALRNRKQLNFLLNAALVDLDQALNQQINAILHHKNYKRLESSWYGLQQLIATQADYHSELSVKIKVLNISWHELGRDLTRAIEFDQSNVFRRVYSDEFDTPGGEPFGVLLGDYYVSHQQKKGHPFNDIDILSEMASISSAALCPFITGADASLFGMESFREFSMPVDFSKLFAQKEYIRWRKLRSTENTRFIGITLPHVLMRSTYERDGTRFEIKKFHEVCKDTNRDYLWGNACYSFGSVLIRAFANTGWFADIRGGVHEFGEGGVVRYLNYAPLETDISFTSPRAATDVQIDDLLERELSQQGFIPLCSFHSQEYSVFYSNSSLHDPIEYTSEVANANARMSSMIQYMLCVSRFGHFLKIIGRDRIGSVISAVDCQRIFQNWLNQYTTSSDGVNSTIKARYPLAESRVEIIEKPGRPGFFNCIIYLKPHFQLDQLVSSIKLVTELSLGKLRVDS